MILGEHASTYKYDRTADRQLAIELDRERVHRDRPDNRSQLARVARPGGRVLVIDQLAPIDPLEAYPVDRFERARDPSHARLLPEIDLRQLFEANGLVLVRSRQDEERRELEAYLDLAGCTGEGRESALGLAPQGRDAYTATLGWYLLERR